MLDFSPSSQSPPWSRSSIPLWAFLGRPLKGWRSACVETGWWGSSVKNVPAGISGLKSSVVASASARSANAMDMESSVSRNPVSCHECYPLTTYTVATVPGTCHCLHNTQGEHCERCAEGFYGNAYNGKLDDCKSCGCPGNKSCVEDPDGGEAICTECPEGYSGTR